MRLLGIESQYRIHEVPFQWDGGWQMHLIFNGTNPLPQIDAEDAWRICNEDDATEAFYYEDRGTVDVVPEEPIRVEYEGNTYLLVGSLYGMDEFGIDQYET